jgi:threonine synthase
MHATGLRCPACSATYPLDARYACDACFGGLEPDYDYDAIRAGTSRESIAAGPPTLWRYAALLPVAPLVGGLPVGLTPLVPVPRLAAALGLREVYVKLETANPTHSFKDRVVALAAAKAVELGLGALACASTGNLAGAVAAQAAALGLDAYIFIPADLEPEKIVAASVPGPHLFAIEGNYDAANRLCSELAWEQPWGFVNFTLRPYYAQGSKTLAYETAEQLGWRLPAQTVAPIASGSLYTKLDRGFRDLVAADLAHDEAPRAFGAQATGCSPVARAFAAGAERVQPVKPDTIARSLAIGAPADGDNALRVARATGGAIIDVGDEAIVEAIGLLARTTGVFTETAGGVTVAALAELARTDTLDPDAPVVVYITGDGLKTPEAAARFVAPARIAADVDAVEAVLAREEAAAA